MHWIGLQIGNTKVNVRVCVCVCVCVCTVVVNKLTPTT